MAVTSGDDRLPDINTSHFLPAEMMLEPALIPIICLIKLHLTCPEN